jgi:glycerol-3-phosphate acyltransferase PlsX
MGGDHAPEAVVEGALLAQSCCSADLVLVGNEPVIRDLVGGGPDNADLQIVHAPQSITMEEAGPIAIRRKLDSSLNVAMRMLAQGEVDAVISAGNTSAIVASAKHYVELLPGLRRPALAVSLPTETGRPVLLDAGAHAQAGTVHLAQSAALAHIYLKVTQGLDQPRIGLLNIGREPGKGTSAVQRAFALIKRSGLNFIGNIEPNDLFSGLTDSVICEGFVGNIILKMYEGISDGLIRKLSKKIEQCGDESREDLSRILEDFERSYHYSHVGGAPLLGVKKTVVVAHGRSNSTAINSAIQLTCRVAAENICGKMSEALEQDSTLVDFKFFNALLLLENLKKKWRFSPR